MEVFPFYWKPIEFEKFGDASVQILRFRKHFSEGVVLEDWNVRWIRPDEVVIKI